VQPGGLQIDAVARRRLSCSADDVVEILQLDRLWQVGEEASSAASRVSNTATGLSAALGAAW
jgi:hypothetical protein